jgi:hypothetical protein
MTEPPPSSRVALRLCTAVGALGLGAAALVIAILLVKTVLG